HQARARSAVVDIENRRTEAHMLDQIWAEHPELLFLIRVVQTDVAIVAWMRNARTRPGIGSGRGSRHRVTNIGVPASQKNFQFALCKAAFATDADSKTSQTATVCPASQRDLAHVQKACGFLDRQKIQFLGHLNPAKVCCREFAQFDQNVLPQANSARLRSSLKKSA